MAKTAEARYRNNRQSAAVEGLVAHNCHFSANTLEVMRLHSALTNSRGISGLVRHVMEFYLAGRINFDDPRYAGVDPVEEPKELYRGHNHALGLE